MIIRDAQVTSTSQNDDTAQPDITPNEPTGHDQPRSAAAPSVIKMAAVGVLSGAMGAAACIAAFQWVQNDWPFAPRQIDILDRKLTKTNGQQSSLSVQLNDLQSRLSQLQSSTTQQADASAALDRMENDLTKLRADLTALANRSVAANSSEPTVDLPALQAEFDAQLQAAEMRWQAQLTAIMTAQNNNRLLPLLDALLVKLNAGTITQSALDEVQVFYGPLPDALMNAAQLPSRAQLITELTTMTAPQTPSAGIWARLGRIVADQVKLRRITDDLDTQNNPADDLTAALERARAGGPHNPDEQSWIDQANQFIAAQTALQTAIQTIRQEAE